MITTNTRWTYLSYPLDENTPAYGGGDGFVMTAGKCMDNGDSCNTSYWSFPNHLGTHLDFPRHFSSVGKTVDAYREEDFICSRVGFVDLGEVDAGRIISHADIEDKDLPDEIEILLIKTGFSYKRSLSEYWQRNPGFSPELADYLRSSFPALRILGFDSISVSSFANRDLGRAAHKSFLDHASPLLLLEDMDLSSVTTTMSFKQLIVAPWRVSCADGAPCTVLAEVYDED